MMRVKSSLLLIAAAVIFATSGCVSTRDHQKQVGALQDQLDRERISRERAERELQELTMAHSRKEEELASTRGEAEELSQLLSQLRQAKEARERNLREMEELVRDISGMRVETRPEGDFIVIENEILFDPGRVELKEQAQKTISDTVVPYIKEQLAKNENQLVRIDGHTDGQPIRVSPWDDNHHLSVMRAHSVLSFLAKQGIPDTNMFLAGFGPNQPMVEPPDPDADVAENRRVEILLIQHRDAHIQRLLDDFVR